MWVPWVKYAGEMLIPAPSSLFQLSSFLNYFFLLSYTDTHPGHWIKVGCSMKKVLIPSAKELQPGILEPPPQQGGGFVDSP
jgi:hypothetical protein